MARYRFLLGFAVLSASLLFSAVETKAKVLSNHNRDMKSISIGRGPLARAGKAKTKLYVPTSLARKSKPARQLASKACTNAMMQDELEAFGGCFGGCLRSWGLDYKSGTACGSMCVLAGSGNPIGIAGCAACLGTAEWIIAGCAMKCVWSSSFLPDDGSVAKVRRQPRHLRATYQARIRVSSDISGS
jgi:hypothetical protein